MGQALPAMAILAVRGDAVIGHSDRSAAHAQTGGQQCVGNGGWRIT